MREHCGDSVTEVTVWAYLKNFITPCSADGGGILPQEDIMNARRGCLFIQDVSARFVCHFWDLSWQRTRRRKARLWGNRWADLKAGGRRGI